MKKYLAIVFIVTVLPCYALCPIDENNKVCTLTDNNNNIITPYSPNSSGIRSIQQTLDSLNPLNQEDPMSQMNSPNNSLNYDSGCMLGNCQQSIRNFSMREKRNR